MGKAKIGLRAAALASAAAMILAACGGGSGGGSEPKGSTGGDKPAAGGTLNILSQNEQFDHIDPQRVYTGEDIAFDSSFLFRTLVAFKYSPDAAEGQTLVPDLATDTGKPSDGAKTWAWTLRDGVKFEDGTPITCADIKYGVSRTFATGTITDGPQYAVNMLDVPKAADGTSTYKGPYDASAKNNTAAFDKAVECSTDNKTITFHLAKPVGDFNFATTLTAFSPVPKASDTGEKYDEKPVSSGPYKILEYTKNKQLVLGRNANWDKASDPYRKAYPDKIVLNFGVEASVVDQRMIKNSTADQGTIPYGGNPVLPASLTQVFGQDQFKSRRVNDLDPYVRYIAINTQHVPDLNVRKAIVAALDRQQLRTIAGGNYAGDLADGVIKPNLPKDYAPTGIFDGLLGQKIPPNGDPVYAKKLLAGKTVPTLRYDYNQTPTNDQGAAVVVASLAKIGIKVKPNPIEQGQYYSIILNPKKEGDLALAGWGPDWPNASTVIPELFTPTGGFPLSRANDKGFIAKVAAAKAMTDRDQQAEQWKALDKEAMAQAWIVPTRFGREQRLAGSKIRAASGKGGQIYLWSAFGSWAYGDLYIAK